MREWCFFFLAFGLLGGVVVSGAGYERPAIIELAELAEVEMLDANRRKLITNALMTAKNHGWLKYQFGSADPKHGGFDCSGAMYFVLRESGLKPGRSSADQYLWIKKADGITEVGEDVKTLDDPAFAALKPGDLLFWSGTYEITDARKVAISHVSMYLGKAKSDGRQLMIGSSNGRSYRGTRQNGYGVFDFRLPSKRSKSTFVGYGTPLGLVAEDDE